MNPFLIFETFLKVRKIAFIRIFTVILYVKTSKSLDCSHNNLVSFDLPEFKQLSRLNLSWNNLNRLDLLIATFESKTPNLTNLDLRSNFFKEENDETYSKISVFDHCVGKLPGLKICNKIQVKDAKRKELQVSKKNLEFLIRLKFQEKVNLSKKTLISRGRNGNTQGCIRLCNSAQYLHNSTVISGKKFQVSNF